MSQLQHLIDSFIQMTISTGTANQTPRLILEIPDITTGDNSLGSFADSCPLICMQDYYIRIIDQIGQSSNNGNSPMSAPYLLFAMQSGSSYIKLNDKAWNAPTIEQLTISRLHDADGVQKEYTNEYKDVRILMTTELLIKNEWTGIICCQIGTVNKTHQKAGLNGAFLGNVTAGKNFNTNEKV